MHKRTPRRAEPIAMPAMKLSEHSTSRTSVSVTSHDDSRSVEQPFVASLEQTPSRNEAHRPEKPVSLIPTSPISSNAGSRAVGTERSSMTKSRNVATEGRTPTSDALLRICAKSIKPQVPQRLLHLIPLLA